MSQQGRLSGKVAIITGGAGEVGVATARRFLEEGAQVVLSGRTRESLEQAVAGLGSNAASFVVADASSEADNKALVDSTLQRHGRLDIFFANAGSEGKMSPIAKYPLDEFRRVLEINVIGPFLGLKYAMPAIASSGGGSVIVCSSIAGLKGDYGMSAYNASKHAVTGLVRAAAKEGAPNKVRVNSVNPGPLDTRMMRSVEQGLGGAKADSVRAGVLATIPLRRYGTADEVANAVVFLASDESSFCTGTILAVEGGISA